MAVSSHGVFTTQSSESSFTISGPGFHEVQVKNGVFQSYDSATDSLSNYNDSFSSSEGDLPSTDFEVENLSKTENKAPYKLTVDQVHNLLNALGIKHSRSGLITANRQAGGLNNKITHKIVARFDSPKYQRRLERLEGENLRIVKEAINAAGSQLQQGQPIRASRKKGFFRRRKVTELTVSSSRPGRVVFSEPKLLTQGGMKVVHRSLSGIAGQKLLTVSKWVKEKKPKGKVKTGHKLWQKHDHPGLMPAWLVNTGKKGESFIVENFENGGDYGRHIDELQVSTPEEAKQLLKSELKKLLPVMEAIAYLHENNLAHLDVKPDNITISAKGLQLADPDFVISKSKFDKLTVSHYPEELMCGTPDYMPSIDGELIAWENFDSCLYQDCFGLGCIIEDLIVEIANQVYPKNSDNQAKEQLGMELVKTNILGDNLHYLKNERYSELALGDMITAIKSSETDSPK